MSNSIDPRVVVALDYSEKSKCLNFVSQLNPDLCRLKIGKEMFTLFGPSLVEELQNKGFDIFLDLKFHDIPNTVAKSVSAAASLGVWMVNVHASGGARMMDAAVESLANVKNRPLLIGVTVLTSMDESDLAGIGISVTPEEQVTRLAKLAQARGLDGVVCSAHEAGTIKRVTGRKFLTVTPGVRPAGSSSDDQRRIMTPTQAILSGSDYLVVGRPVTQSSTPLAVLEAINKEILDV